MSVTVFVEGGGRSLALRTRCREAFAKFLGTELRGRLPRIVACGSRRDALNRFTTAIGGQSGDSFMLLVDSEDKVPPGKRPWDHVHDRDDDRWVRPENSRDEHLHFMAVCMESWLIADRDSLAQFYGADFRDHRLPNTSNLETVGKDVILNSLRKATKETNKGEYDKGKASFAALGEIDLTIVRQRMSYCERFANQLLAWTE